MSMHAYAVIIALQPGTELLNCDMAEVIDNYFRSSFLPPSPSRLTSVADPQRCKGTTSCTQQQGRSGRSAHALVPNWCANLRPFRHIIWCKLLTTVHRRRQGMRAEHHPPQRVLQSLIGP